METFAKFIQCLQNGLDPLQFSLHEVFPGVYLHFFTFQGQNHTCHHESYPHVLAIEYCCDGRIGWSTAHDKSVYLGPGDFAVHTLDNCTDSSFTLPNGYYKGLTIYIDDTQLQSDSFPFLGDSHVFLHNLYDKLCSHHRFSSFIGNEQTESIFSYFYNHNDKIQTVYWKIKIIELLVFLYNVNYDPQKQLTEYRSEQINIIRQIHEDLIHHLNQRLTIESLAKKYLINPTTMKTIFKDIYGEPIASHIKKHRMNLATKLLLQSDKTIAQIARETGYESSSKFAKVFKEHYQLSPNQFRNLHKKN